MSILQITHLSKSFGENEVLKDITLAVNKGEIISVIGPSGSGKSTLLRCAVLLETMDNGILAYEDLEVCRNGKYASKKVLRDARSKFGLVFQNFNLFPHYNVLENITDAPFRVLKRSRKEVEEEGRRLLERFGLADKADAYPCELSGGQQQRVSIARALAMKPEILFFDEPTSALDPELTQEILKVIRLLAEEKMTMVIVTHEIHFARNVSDRVIFMADGVIVEEGPPQQVIDNPINERTRTFLSHIGSMD